MIGSPTCAVLEPLAALILSSFFSFFGLTGFEGTNARTRPREPEH
jgi:hypothetical protein